ncbi:MAG: DNA glycosylase AlkZ-like family protein, partial [Acidimicrobiales bacterium]
MDCSPDDVMGQRLATQRLTTAPLADPVDVVKLLLCAQAQDGPLARYSLGLRVARSDDALVRTELDEGRLVRTHILRPTWHFVAAEDLRWILALTSGKVESSFSGRRRRLG